jgi:circadian clock protein KaiB
MKQSNRPTKTGGHEKYVMQLFVVSNELNSKQAKDNLKRICDTHLNKRYQNKTIDVLEDFQSALEHNVLVIPTLILVEPPPQVRIFGNLSDTKKVIEALRLTGD